MFFSIQSLFSRGPITVISLAVLEFHMNKIIQYVFFCALFLLLNLMFVIYICVIINISSYQGPAPVGPRDSLGRTVSAI